jgi:hypothetical protein
MEMTATFGPLPTSKETVMRIAKPATSGSLRED